MIKILFLSIFTYFAFALHADETPTHFFIVRHGETDWNLQKRMQGHTDIPLNTTGKLQAEELAEKFSHLSFDYAFSSDLQRAFETALILTSKQSLEIKIDQRLRERYFGHWEGQFAYDYHRASLEEKADIESDLSIRKRVFEFLQEVAEQNAGKQIVVVTHGGVLRNLLIPIFQLDCSVDDIATKNCAFIELLFSDGKWFVKYFHGVKLPSESVRFSI